jgi:hypothetical protein
MSQPSYHLAYSGQSLGVLSFAEIEAALATGKLSRSTWSWCEGEPQWQELQGRQEFAHALQAATFIAPPTPLTWEDASGSQGYLKRYFVTWREVLVRPKKTFTTLPAVSTPWRAVGWFVVSAWLSLAVGFLLYSPLLYLARQSLTQQFGALLFADNGPMINLSYLVRAMFGGSLLLLVWLLVGTGFIHGVLRLLGGGQRGWGATLRTLAYVLGTYLWLSLLPCGFVIVPIVTLIASTRALAFTHSQPEWKGLLASFLFAGLSLLSLVGWLVYSVFSFFKNF